MIVEKTAPRRNGAPGRRMGAAGEVKKAKVPVAINGPTMPVRLWREPEAALDGALLVGAEGLADEALGGGAADEAEAPDGGHDVHPLGPRGEAEAEEADDLEDEAEHQGLRLAEPGEQDAQEAHLDDDAHRADKGEAQADLAGLPAVAVVGVDRPGVLEGLLGEVEERQGGDEDEDPSDLEKDLEGAERVGAADVEVAAVLLGERLGEDEEAEKEVDAAEAPPRTRTGRGARGCR